MFFVSLVVKEKKKNHKRTKFFDKKLTFILRPCLGYVQPCQSSVQGVSSPIKTVPKPCYSAVMAIPCYATLGIMVQHMQM